MNPFSSFTFGRFIKTFIPGSVLFLAVMFLVDGYIRMRHGQTFIAYFGLDNHSAEIVSAGMVLSITLGLLGNTVVFAGLNDKFVRNIVKKRNQDLFNYKKLIETMVIEKYISDINTNNERDINFIKNIADPEYMMLHDVEASTILYVQEQYQYYMELHVNMSFSIFLASLSFIARDWLVHHKFIYDRDFGIMFLCVLLIAFLIRTARQNYLRHTHKMLSLLVGHLRKAETGRKDPTAS